MHSLIHYPNHAFYLSHREVAQPMVFAEGTSKALFFETAKRHTQ